MIRLRDLAAALGSRNARILFLAAVISFHLPSSAEEEERTSAPSRRDARFIRTNSGDGSGAGPNPSLRDEIVAVIADTRNPNVFSFVPVAVAAAATNNNTAGASSDSGSGIAANKTRPGQEPGSSTTRQVSTTTTTGLPADDEASRRRSDAVGVGFGGSATKAPMPLLSLSTFESTSESESESRRDEKFPDLSAARHLDDSGRAGGIATAKGTAATSSFINPAVPLGGPPPSLPPRRHPTTSPGGNRTSPTPSPPPSSATSDSESPSSTATFQERAVAEKSRSKRSAGPSPSAAAAAAATSRQQNKVRRTERRNRDDGRVVSKTSRKPTGSPKRETDEAEWVPASSTALFEDVADGDRLAEFMVDTEYFASESPSDSAGALSRQRKSAAKLENFDTSCLRIVDGNIQFIPAPDVPHAKMKYNRRKNKKPPYNTFLEAIYSCEDGYSMASEDQDRLFCSLGLWNGRRPQCSTPEEIRQSLLLTNSVTGGDDNDAVDKNGVHESTTSRSNAGVEGKSTCGIDNGGCEHICGEGADGIVACSCRTGYELHFNRRSCVDVNECLMRNGHGPCQDSCANTEGSYVCSCEGIPGTQLGPDRHSCEDIDECAAADRFRCSHVCINTLGTAFCSCPAGLVLGPDWKTCKDIDECEDESISSSCPHGCLNTVGSYLCLPDPSSPGRNSSQTPPPAVRGSQPSLTSLGRKKSGQPVDPDPSPFDNHQLVVLAEDRMSSTAATSPTMMAISPTYLPQPSSNPVKRNSSKGKDANGNGKGGKKAKKGDQYDNYYYGEYDDEDDEYYYDPEEKEAREKQRNRKKSDEEEETGKPEEDEDNGSEEEDPDREEEGGAEPDGKTDSETKEDKEDLTTSPPPRHHQAATSPATPAAEYPKPRTTTAPPAPQTTEQTVRQVYEATTRAPRHQEDHSSSSPPRTADEEDSYSTTASYDRDRDGENSGGVVSTTASPAATPAPTIRTPAPKVSKDNRVEPTDEDDEDEDYPPDYNAVPEEDEDSNEIPQVDPPTQAPEVREEKEEDVAPQPTSVPETTTSAVVRTTPMTTTRAATTTTTRTTTTTTTTTTPKPTKQRRPPPDEYSEEYDEDKDDYYGGKEDGYDYYDENGNGKDKPKSSRGESNAKDKEEGQPAAPPPTTQRPTPVVTTTAVPTGAPHMTTTTRTKPEMVTTEASAEEDEEDPDEENEVEPDLPSRVTTVRPIVTRTTTSPAPLTTTASRPEVAPTAPVETTSTESGQRSQCEQGLRWNPISDECVDLDECEEGFGCTHICINTYGSAYCECPPGLELQEDEKTCGEPVDPCSVDNGGCQHICETDEDGGGTVRCLCPAGYAVSGPDGRSCEDVDECALYPDECSSRVPNSACANRPGSYHCECLPGFQEVDGSCLAMNPCATANGGCAHICTSRSDGSHDCSCETGYALGPDGASCLDIDECVFDETCAATPNSECVNSQGSYTCVCDEGFAKNDKGECSREDPCKVDNGGCSHTCRDGGDGLAVCSCPPGYELGAGDDATCTDVNECQAEGACARAHSYCFNTAGSFVCACDLGYTYDEDVADCVDEDECSEDNFGCEQKCENADGRAFCSCYNGYNLAEDGKSCKDIDECVRMPCGPGGTCRNTNGSYECHCPDGYESSQGRCEDVNECLFVECPGTCENTPGSFTCRNPCDVGFLHENGGCVDIDECAGNYTCLPTEDCINTPGSYLCLLSCAPGFERNPETRICEDIDECEDDPCEIGECINSIGSYRCLTPCPSGYERIEMECMDIDECLVLKDPCSEDHCLNLPGSYSCTKKCVEGYELVSGECVDVDECLMDEEACPENTRCLNTPGSYHCRLECPTGFQDHSGECVDIDECLQDVCQNGMCINTDGSYFCTCDPGYSPVAGVCVDVNECESSPCGHGECINKPGSYYCFCSPGYVFANGSCSDEDECARPNTCPGGACVNTVGSYFCKCKPGYRMVKGVCADIDECEDDPCFAGKCVNSPGSYECHCRDGFAKVNGACVDINECEEGKCSGGECINTYGSYRCYCPPGYENVDGVCKDVDECERTRPCGLSGSMCVNLPGSYSCDCQPGHRFVRGRCEDIDECASGTNPCTAGSCINTPGSFKCACSKGYRLENGICVDINECETNNGGCQQVCKNHPGFFKCTCLPGYQVDYRNASKCLDVNECSVYNGGCSHDCINTKGSFHCGCSDDYTIGPDKKTCIRKPFRSASSGLCGKFTPPKHGQALCQESRRVGNESFSPGAWCRVTCEQGFKLDGSFYSYCGRDGRWHGRAGVCVPLHCNKLPVPKYGRVWPPNCSKGKTFVNSKCYFSCDIGFYLIGDPIWTCQSNLEWKSNGKRKKNRCKRQGIVHPKKMPKPFIQCPPDIRVNLAAHQSTAHVKFAHPKSNVDRRYIEAEPYWASRLEGDFKAGKTRIEFRASSPAAQNSSASCSFVINIIDAEPPTVFQCPASFEVRLPPGKEKMKVYWQAPKFTDNVGVVHVFNNHDPGMEFEVGKHRTYYIAVDDAGNRARCHFTVTVSPEMSRSAQHSLGRRIPVVCPGSSPGSFVKAFVWHVPPGCTVLTDNQHVSSAQWGLTSLNSPESHANSAAVGRPPQPSDPGASRTASTTSTNFYSSFRRSSDGNVRQFRCCS